MHTQHNSFRFQRLASVTAATISPARIVVVRVVAGSGTTMVECYNGQSTAASTKVMTVKAVANSSEEQVNPFRTDSGYVTVKLNTLAGSAEAFIGIA